MQLQTDSMKREEIHHLLSTAISPLPIAFISTVSPEGIFNAAPFSYICPICSKPPLICVSIGLREKEKKDTVRNIEYSNDFVINVVDESMIKPAVQASADYPYGVDEMKATGLTALPCEKVKSPRIAEAKVSLECRLVQKLEFMEELREGQGQGLRPVIFGEVLLAHIQDSVWVNGRIDPRRLKPIGRMGKDLYCRTEDIFELEPAPVK
jgi:flavin reductase (DIM6/NTAB) family NADH-FMN oxidoreductase RutF